MVLEKQSPESAPKLRRVERRQLRNKKALLSAARRLIHEKGVDTTTMQEITEIADVGVGTMYNYFKSKDDLIRQIVRDEMVDLVEATLIGRESSFEPIRQGGYHYWYFLQKLSQMRYGNTCWSAQSSFLRRFTKPWSQYQKRNSWIVYIPRILLVRSRILSSNSLGGNPLALLRR